MCKTAEILSGELREILSGDTWYGSPVVEILKSVNERDISRRITAEHTIAEILLHCTVWTSEIINRLKGEEAGEPEAGDWPDPDQFSWEELRDMFTQVNDELLALVSSMPEEFWEQPIKDKRNSSLGTGVSNLKLVRGLIQHHIYHSGQIALLNKQFSTL